MAFLMEILIFLVTALSVLYFYSKYQYQYWKRKNIPYIPPSFIFGNLRDIILMRRSPAYILQEFYQHENAKDEPIVGIHLFHKPGLLIRDPELIKMILVKDFNKFSNRYSKSDPHADSLGSNNLFFIRNPTWKQMRSSITPVFTSGKMKQMFPLMEEIGVQLDSHLNGLPFGSKNAVSLEIKEICALYTTDVIASIAYGVQANSIKNPNSDFRRNGKKVFHFTYPRGFEFNMFFFLPQWVPILKCKVFKADVTAFLRDTIKYVMEEREASGQKRNDLIDILISLKNTKPKEGELKFEGDTLVAQAAVFFTAGFETASSTMSFGMYELSKNPDLQERLRAEIRDVFKNNNTLNYDVVNSMEYLNMVIQEVLRMYPPLPFLDRECTLSSGEEYSLEPISDYKIPNGMPVYIPVYAIQRDEKYFPEPNKFNPERFSPENKDSIVPYTNLPFGTGPHNCIGERFGILQAKIGLIYFLKNHRVQHSEKSLKTMKLHRRAVIIQAEGGIQLDVVHDPIK